MNGEKNDVNKVAMLIKESSNIAVIPSKIPGIDAFGAGAALYYMIREQDKNVNFLYKGKIPDKGQSLIAQNHITNSVDNRSLLVSIDYSGTEASKVKYSTEDDVLYLKISPISTDFDKISRIKSRITGFDFDTIFVIGAQGISDLGSIYHNLDAVSKISKIVNIDITNKNERFGFVNVVDNNVNSLSLLVMEKYQEWGLSLNERAAKALLKGIISKETPHIS